MNKKEYIKQKKEQFEKNLEWALDENKLYVLIFTDKKQSSCYGRYEYCDMHSGHAITWRENIRRLLNGTLRYHSYSINKWITYRCNNCGCNSFYCYKDWFVCSNCFSEHLINDFAITFKTKEDAEKVTTSEIGTVKTNTWHRFGIISEYEFDEFMKNCTNPEQDVYW